MINFRVRHLHQSMRRRKGTIMHKMEPMAGSLISDPILTKSTVQDMERCRESEMGNAHGMNGSFIKIQRRLYVQGQPGPLVAKHTHRSKRKIDNPCSLAPFPIPDSKTISSGNLLNKTDLSSGTCTRRRWTRCPRISR